MSLFSDNTPRRLGDLVRDQASAANRFLNGTPSISDLRVLGYTQYCGSTSDCGAGSRCVDGFCRPIGTGNTTYGPEGCSSGPASNPPVGLPCINCGYDSEKSCDGTRTCRFTPYGVQCWCGGSTGSGSTGTGDGPGPEDETGKPCSKWCTTEYASYGSYSEGCGEKNTCSECYECQGDDDNVGTCQSRDTGAPCHCYPDRNEPCGPIPGRELECCNHKFTCQGRIDNLTVPYCYDKYRVGIPRCYDPDYPCKDPDSDDCQICTDYTKTVLSGDSFEIPEGCDSTGEIIQELSGDKVILYKCCEQNEEAVECRECKNNFDCLDDQCCIDGVCYQPGQGPAIDRVCPEKKCKNVNFVPEGGYPKGFIPLNPCECYRFTVTNVLTGYWNVYTIASNCTTVNGSLGLDGLAVWSMDLTNNHVAVSAGFFTEFFDRRLENFWPINQGTFVNESRCGESNEWDADGIAERMASVIYVVYLGDYQASLGNPYRIDTFGIFGGSLNLLGGQPPGINDDYYYEVGFGAVADIIPCEEDRSENEYQGPLPPLPRIGGG